MRALLLRRLSPLPAEITGLAVPKLIPVLVTGMQRGKADLRRQVFVAGGERASKPATKDG